MQGIDRSGSISAHDGYNGAMDQTIKHGMYGIPPAQLAPHPEGATQFSPLIPGSAALEDAKQLESMLVLAPPGTLERRYVMVLALQALSVGSALTVLAHKDKGGSRIAQELRDLGCTVQEDARQHHRICTTTRPKYLGTTEDAFNAGAPQVVKTTGLWSQPGVFSWNRLDAGTGLLLDHLPPLGGRGADVGCGIGTLAIAALASPAITELTLIDIDRRALEAAQNNISDPRAHYRWLDIRDTAPDVRELDFVIMNPPFHDGGMEDKSLGLRFVQRASDMLKKGGTCWLIANRHLPYEGLMHQAFKNIVLKHEDTAYKIYAAEK